MIDRIAASAAVTLLNRMLAREQWARDRLQPFAGRSARFEMAPFWLALKVAADGTLLVADEAAPAVTVSFDATAMPLALADPRGAMKHVRLAGDAEFAQALSQVLQNLRPEPEEELARFIGDAGAQRVVGFLRMSAGHWKQLADRMLQSGADYLVAENPVVVGRAEVERFCTDVADVRDAVERLEKRLELLEQRG